MYKRQLLDKGLNEQRAKESLAYFYEVYLRQNPRHSEDFKEETWLDFLNQVPVKLHNGEYSFDQFDAKQNVRKIKKRFGSIKNETKVFEAELYAIESYLMVLNDALQVSGRDAQKIIHIVMNRLLDIENQDSTDYSDFAGEDLLYMADGLEEICNPYINEELEKVLKPYVNIHEPQNFDYIFKNVFLCLNKVLDSIDFWDKEFGKDGYFRYIRQFMDSHRTVSYTHLDVYKRQAVNSLGSDVVAAVTAAMKISIMLTQPLETLGLTMATYGGQNLGANQIERIFKGVHVSYIIGAIYCVVAFVFVYFTFDYLSLLFIDASETVIISEIKQYLIANSICYYILSILFILRNLLQGLGYSFLAMFGGVAEMIARCIVAFCFVGMLGFDAICICLLYTSSSCIQNNARNRKIAYWRKNNNSK